MDASLPCPKAHHAYDSEMLARNAAVAHRLELEHCRGFEPFRHGDHWHVGHVTPIIGDDCKADEQHRAVRRRIGKVRDLWQHPGPVRRIGSRSSARRVTMDNEARNGYGPWEDGGP
jgi:hypothetical protein